MSTGTRRDFLRLAGLGAAAAMAWPRKGQAAQSGARDPGVPSPGAAKPSPYNILFILTDQERYFRPGELPEGYTLPAHERLLRRGTSFVNHRIS
jgi:arylsulfatase